MMKRREFITLLGGATAWPIMARAQQKPAGIGFLGAGAAETSVPLMDALKLGLRENGLVEAKDYVLEPRWAEGRYERFPTLAHELIDKGARVIIVTTIAGAHAAQPATSVIPIVMASMNDPVGNGLVASLARPGGNTTGLATLNEDVTPKLVEYMHAFLPRATTIAVLFNPTNPSNPLYLDSARVQAVRLGIAVKDFATEDRRSSWMPRSVRPRHNDPTRCWSYPTPPPWIWERVSQPVAADCRRFHPFRSHRRRWWRSVMGFPRRGNYRRSAYFVKKVLDGVKPAWTSPVDSRHESCCR